MRPCPCRSRSGASRTCLLNRLSIVFFRCYLYRPSMYFIQKNTTVLHCRRTVVVISRHLPYCDRMCRCETSVGLACNKHKPLSTMAHAKWLAPPPENSRDLIPIAHFSVLTIVSAIAGLLLISYLKIGRHARFFWESFIKTYLQAVCCRPAAEQYLGLRDLLLHGTIDVQCHATN